MLCVVPLVVYICMHYINKTGVLSYHFFLLLHLCHYFYVFSLVLLLLSVGFTLGGAKYIKTPLMFR